MNHISDNSDQEEAKAGSTRSIVALTMLSLIFIALSLLSFFYVSSRGVDDQRYMLRVAEQKTLSQQIAKYALTALQGGQEAFTRLRWARLRFDSLLDELENGAARSGLPPSPAEVDGYLQNMKQEWLELRKEADLITAAKEPLLRVREYAQAVSDSMPRIVQSSSEIVSLLVEEEASQSQVAIASRQLMLAQRMQDNAMLVLAGSSDMVQAIELLARDAVLFGQVMQGLRRGDAALDIDPLPSRSALDELTTTAELYLPIRDHVTEIIGNAPALLPALEVAERLPGLSDKVHEAAADLLEALAQSPGQFIVRGIKVGPFTAIYLGALAALWLFLLGYVLVVDAKRREGLSAQRNARNQQAITRLVDEIGDLADGNLAVSASTDEQSIGPIVRAINYAVAALRDLVTSINATTGKVLSAVQESRAVALHSAQANEVQVEQISAATVSMSDMAVAMDEVASNAKGSAEVAQHAVQIAGNGAAAVRRTIEGMDSIREQIQETSKRIKRLGESSQEIGDIVELIEDIADQTNILALNAAIQAAMAGEAGRGFALVADEVQRLAERSTLATKQIDGLVKTIQADTQEAVISMEASTAGVVAGTKLAEEAGRMLTEIENVSNHIAEVTSKIAESAQEQSAEANGINDSMKVMQEMTIQASENSTQTATSIGEVEEAANELQRSVAGFRLPE